MFVISVPFKAVFGIRWPFILAILILFVICFLSDGCTGRINPVEEARRKHEADLAWKAFTKDIDKGMREFKLGVRPIERTTH